MDLDLIAELAIGTADADDPEVRAIRASLASDPEFAADFNSFQRFLRRLLDDGPGPEPPAGLVLRTIVLVESYKAKHKFDTGYEAVAAELQADAARRLRPLIHKQLKALPKGTFADKQEAARWVNGELRRFSLAIQDTITGQPAVLIALPAEPASGGHLVFLVRPPGGEEYRTLQYGNVASEKCLAMEKLPPFALIPAPEPPSHEKINFYDYFYSINESVSKFTAEDRVVTGTGSAGGSPWVEKASAMLGSLPGDYAVLAEALAAANHGLRRAIADRLQPALNAHVQAMPQGTHEEKQAVCKWVNAELRPFGLAVRCPNTGLPAILVADTQGADRSKSRFRFEIVNADGKKTRTFGKAQLPPLELIEDKPRVEALVGWADRVKRSPSPKSRAD